VGNRLCKHRNKVPVYKIYCEPEFGELEFVSELLICERMG
jgi:hypothetical protein